MTSRKRSLSDMRSGRSDLTSSIDKEEYNAKVLQLTEDATEEGVDKRLALEAHDLGIDSLPILKASKLDSLVGSLSATTIGSDPCNQGSVQSRLSQSTGPTSCGSSERRQVAQSPYKPSTSPTHSVTPSILSAEEKRSSRHSLRASIKKMTGFRKRKSGLHGSHHVLATIDGNATTLPADRRSVNDGERSPISVKSYTSSSSAPVSIGPDDKATAEDETAMRRTMDASELQSLRERQLEERERFLAYQRDCLGRLREQQKLAKRKMHDIHVQAAAEMEEKVGQMHLFLKCRSY